MISCLRLLLLTAVCCAALYPAAAQSTSEPYRPRIVVTADPELDDLNSLIRFLLYSTDVQVEGLVYASSQFHWKGDGTGTKWFVPGREYTRFGLDICPCTSWRWAEGERFIHDAVEAYAQAYPNLKTHHPGYPDPQVLLSKIRYGNIEFDGDFSKDSPGSELIKSLMLDEAPGPLFITAWGGQSTIARALKSIEEQYGKTPQWARIREKVSQKVILLPSGDQDNTYANYIKPNWPGIEYRQFTDGPRYGYGAQLNAAPGDSLLLTAAWMRDNITSRGPLGALYRVWGDGKQMVKGDIFDYFGLDGYTNEQLKQMGYIVWMPVQPKGSWLGEGDTGTFMNMLGNGLRAYESATYGGWGGQMSEALFNFSFNDSISAGDTSLAAMLSVVGSVSKAAGTGVFPDFFPAAQHDMAARMHWSVTPNYADANHAPEVSVQGALNIRAFPGETVQLRGRVSDPDGDALSLRWWQFRVGTYRGVVRIDNPESAQTSFTVPADAVPGNTIHLILEATDAGAPALTRYKRVVVTVKKR